VYRTLEIHENEFKVSFIEKFSSLTSLEKKILNDDGRFGVVMKTTGSSYQNFFITRELS
jgi:hypothetical protein